MRNRDSVNRESGDTRANEKDSRGVNRRLAGTRVEPEDSDYERDNAPGLLGRGRGIH